MKAKDGVQTFNCRDLKLVAGSNALIRALDLNTKAEDTHRKLNAEGEGTLRIITYSLTHNLGSIQHFINKLRPRRIRIIAHEKFCEEAKTVRCAFTNLRIRLHPQVHSKVVLIQPDIVILGSANLTNYSKGEYHNTCAILRSSEAYKWYFENEWNTLWEESMKLEGPPTNPGLGL